MMSYQNIVKQNIVKILSGLGLIFSLTLASAQNQDFEEILKILDNRSNFQTDLSATMTLSRTDPEAGDDSRTVQMFRRDDDNLFLFLIEKPETQLGQGYLRVNDGLWFYDPESRQFTFTSLSESFEGSDARNRDFGASSLAEDYRVTSGTEGTLGNFDVWILELEATNSEVTYPFRKIWVTKENSLLLKSEDYSLTKRLLRTSFFPSYAKSGESFIANKMIFVDALVENKSTTITLTDISTATIPDNVFTKAYVERVNR